MWYYPTDILTAHEEDQVSPLSVSPTYAYRVRPCTAKALLDKKNWIIFFEAFIAKQRKLPFVSLTPHPDAFCVLQAAQSCLINQNIPRPSPAPPPLSCSIQFTMAITFLTVPAKFKVKRGNNRVLNVQANEVEFVTEQ